MVVFEVPKKYVMKNILWNAWVNQIYTPFKNVPLKLIAGDIPSDLNGQLYRNHTSCQIRNHVRCGHLYDGDGSILKININKGNIQASYDYIKTKSYLEEEKLQKFTHYSWGINPQRNLLEKFINLSKNITNNFKNTANANIFKFPNVQDKALALGFHGLPYQFDINTLETIKEFNFDGFLKQNDTLGLNFRIDYQNQLIYNFSYDSSNGIIKLIEFDFNGNITNSNQHKLNESRILIQDFCYAGDYIVFLISPQTVDFLKNPLSKKTYSDRIDYNVNLGTQILIFDTKTLNFVSENICDPFLSNQIVNGITNKKGILEIDYLMYTDFKINQLLSGVVKNERIDVSGYSAKIHRMAINPQNGIIQKTKKRCEYPSNNPITPPLDQGKRWGDTYFNINKSKKEYDIGNTVAKLDNQNNLQIYTQFSKDTYLGQPILTKDQKYLLTVGINSIANQNELHIINSENMQQIGVLEIPMLLPYSFQGMWLEN